MEHLKKNFNRLTRLKFDTPIVVPEDLKEFIYLILTVYNNKYYTCYLNGKCQCRPGCNRSFTDLYKIVKFYKPDTTFKEVANKAMELVKNGEIYLIYCITINKLVLSVDDEYNEYGDYINGNDGNFGSPHTTCRALKMNFIEFMKYLNQ